MTGLATRANSDVLWLTVLALTLMLAAAATASSAPSALIG